MWSIIARGTLLAIAVGLSVFHLYTGAFGSLEAFLQRLIHVGLGFLLLFLSAIPARREDGAESGPGWRDRSAAIVALACLVAPLGYVLLNYRHFAGGRFPYVSELSVVEIALGIAFIGVTIEAARRTMGTSIAIIAIVFFAYPFIGPYLPGLFYHTGYPLETVIDALVFTTDGIFGIPVGISATFVILFIIFAAFLEITGFGDFMMALSKGLAGTRRGGPAKMAILASGLIGTVSGSAVANVVTTGSFTIPLMKRTGYSSNFAGAVEAAASTGGQFMPPVMGAQAFIMSQYTGIPYIEIVLYSTLPAVLYYVGLWINLDLEARRLGLSGLDREEIGTWVSDVLRRCHLVLPLVLLVGLLAMGHTPMYASVWSIVALVPIAMAVKRTRFGLARIVTALERGALLALPVIAATAVSGIIIISVTLTGLGDRFTFAMLSLAQGSLLLGLIYAMVAALVLGTGLPTIPAYIVQVGLVVPALVKMGLEPVVAHLFVIYFSCLSMITPPVAISAYAAAGVSGGNAFRTSLIASKLAAVGYIVPFMFAYNQSLLLIGDIQDVIPSVVTALAGVFGLALALQGHFYTPSPWWERLVAAAAALLLIHARMDTDIIGVLLLLGVVARQRHRAYGWPWR